MHSASLVSLVSLVSVLAVLSLACTSSAAAAPDKPATPAAPATPTAPAADACRPGGAVLFEIDHRVEPGSKLATSTTRVFASGAWTREDRTAEGKALAPRTGCLGKPEVKQLEATLRGVPWKIARAEMTCMAFSPEFTVYQVDGKTVFTRKLCSPESLDDKSRARLDAAIAQVERVAGKPAATP